MVACPWTEQAEAAELEAAANISHDFVDDRLDEQADANEEVPQILFDRVNPVAVEEIGKRVLSKVFRNGPTVMRICGDILAQCTREGGRGEVLSHYVQGGEGDGRHRQKRQAFLRSRGGSQEEEEGRGGRGGV